MDTNNQSRGGKDGEEQGAWRGALLCLGLCCVVCLMFLYPAAMQSLFAPAEREDWGAVQSARYVGGIRYTTQFTTVSSAGTTRQFLLIGVVNIAVGTALEKREHVLARQVCIQGTGDCWDLLGN